MISVICPFLNEVRFVKAWLTCVRKFASEIIVMDTGSTDETAKYLRSQKVDVLQWPRKLGYKLWNRDFNEFAVREKLRKKAKGNWIVSLDMDELIGEDFLSFLEHLPESIAGRKIARMREMKFWGTPDTIRMPSFWPPISKLPNGKYRLLRNYRGATGGKIVRVFKNEPHIRYSHSREHPMVQDGRGRWTYRDKSITLDTNIPFYHYHFAFPPKGTDENRFEQRNQKIKTKSFSGRHPEEFKLIIKEI